MSDQDTALGQDTTQDPPAEAGLSSQDTEQQEQGQQEQQQDTRDYEAEARDMGWVPQSEYRGDPARWKPAQKYVEDGSRILPIVRSQLNREKEEREREKAEFKKRIERIEKMNEATRKREQDNFARELARIKTEQRKAVESGDTEAFERLEKERDAIKPPEDEPKTEAKDDTKTQYDTAVAEFKKANAWYGSDEDLTAYAEGYSQKLARDTPGIPLEDNLRKTAEKVRQAFPQKFKKPNGHASVDGGGSFDGAPTKANGLASKLPQEAKSQAERDVKAGLYKTVEEWANVYYER